jgi:dTDP-4-amino-4,6-dideoxygalactose transaminase
MESKITEKTRAVIPVHLYGHNCDMDHIMAIAKKRKIYVLEDASHAF